MEIAPVGTALIHNVQKRGPADSAGLANGDRIPAINGNSVSGKSYDEIVAKIQKTGTHLRLMVVPGDTSLVYDESEEALTGDGGGNLFESSASSSELNQLRKINSNSVEASPEDYCTGRESSSSYASCQSSSLKNWPTDQPTASICSLERDPGTPPTPRFVPSHFADSDSTNFLGTSSGESTGNDSRSRSRSSDRHQSDRIQALIREMKPVSSNGAGIQQSLHMPSHLMLSHAPLRAAYSQDSLHYTQRHNDHNSILHNGLYTPAVNGSTASYNGMGQQAISFNAAPQTKFNSPVQAAQRRDYRQLSMGNLYSGPPAPQGPGLWRPPPPSYDEAVAALQRSGSDASSKSLAESLLGPSVMSNQISSDARLDLSRTSSAGVWPPRRVNVPPPLQLQRGGSSDNVRMRDHPICYSNHRKQHLPEIRENIATGMPLSPGGNPVLTGKVAETVKIISTGNESKQELDRMKAAAGGEPERLSRLQRVGNLAKQFEEGPVNPVGALKLYHAQSYKRELAKVCQDKPGKVWAKAQCFDSSLPSSPRLSVASSISEAGSLTPFGQNTPSVSPKPSSSAFASGRISPAVRSPGSSAYSVLPDSRKRFAIHSEHYDAVRSSPDIFSPESPVPVKLERIGNELELRRSLGFENSDLENQRRRSRPESFLVAVTGDSPIIKDSFTDSLAGLAGTPHSPALQFARIPDNDVFLFTSPSSSTVNTSGFHYPARMSSTFDRENTEMNDGHDTKQPDQHNHNDLNDTIDKPVFADAETLLGFESQFDVDSADRNIGWRRKLKLPFQRRKSRSRNIAGNSSNERLKLVSFAWRKSPLFATPDRAKSAFEETKGGSDSNAVLLPNRDNGFLDEHVFTVNSATDSAQHTPRNDRDILDSHNREDYGIFSSPKGGSSPRNLMASNRNQSGERRDKFPSGPYPPQNARIHKFINFFASGDQSSSTPPNNTEQPGSEDSSGSRGKIYQDRPKFRHPMNSAKFSQTSSGSDRSPRSAEGRQNSGARRPLGMPREERANERKNDSPNGTGYATAKWTKGDGDIMRRQRDDEVWNIEGDVSLKNLTRLGPLVHKETALGSSRKAALSEKGWTDVWAILHGHKLFLSLDQPAGWDLAHKKGVVVQTSNGRAAVIDVHSSIVDIAYDTNEGSGKGTKKHTFRLSTQQQTEHLFQVENADDMLRWIEDLQKSARSGAGEVGTTDSMALIIKRYEARSQAVSPTSKTRRALLKSGGQNSAPVFSGLEPPPAENTNNRENSSPLANGDAADSQVDGKSEATTPGRTRKWRKVRKSGSCPVEPKNPYQNQGPLLETATFGQNLAKCPTSGESDYVPLFVQLCVKVIEAHGMETVGVYRIPGNTAAVNALMTSLDKGFEHVDFSDPRWKDVNVVSSLLKAFFRKLQEPILTDKYYPIFIDANRIADHSNRLKKLRTLLHKLPRHNYETLKYLLEHLRKVAGRGEVNKMEARNLALMFGPSCIRPSGDNMAAMVTHMSDQCKIMESLIIYCDWLFGTCGDNPPDPTPAEAHEDCMMTSSFSDMSDLLRRVNRTDEDLEKTKDNIVKSILNVRRGSKKGKSATKEDSSVSSQESKSSHKLPYRKTVSDRPTTASAIKHKQKMKALTAEEAVNGRFQERNIDEAIESRSRAAKDPITEEPQNGIEEEAGEGAGNSDYDLAVDAMRRQREEQIYTARRIFITGSSMQKAGSEGTVEKSDEVEAKEKKEDAEYSEKLDGLVRHTRHLNLGGLADSTLNVLSPETREKIKRLQTDGQILKRKEQQQNVQLRKVESARQRVERAWVRAKADAEHEDYLDAFASDPVHPDALSVTSDYSTTSSAAGGDGGIGVSQGGSKLTLMTNSCNGALPLSDYSSTGSPLTPHLPQKLESSLTRSQASVNSTGSDNVSNSDGSIYDRKRLRHVVPVGTTRMSKSPPTSASLVAREKAWYELEDEENRNRQYQNPHLSSAGIKNSVAHHVNNSTTVTFKESLSSQNGSTNGNPALDQNRNLTNTTAAPTVPVNVAPAQRGLTGTERPMSRISQKIRFRSKSSSADKRKDPRRHTLTDLENLKTALFGNSHVGNTESKDSSANSVQESGGNLPKRHGSQKAHRSNSGAPLVLGKVAKSKTGKLKNWFKESFRKSSPELYEPEDKEVIISLGEPINPARAAVM